METGHQESRGVMEGPQLAGCHPPRNYRSAAKLKPLKLARSDVEPSDDSGSNRPADNGPTAEVIGGYGPAGYVERASPGLAKN